MKKVVADFPLSLRGIRGIIYLELDNLLPRFLEKKELISTDPRMALHCEGCLPKTVILNRTKDFVFTFFRALPSE